MRHFIFVCLLFQVSTLQAQKADLIIQNGKIVDGTGNSWYYGDVAIKDGKIIGVGKLKNKEAVKND